MARESVPAVLPTPAIDGDRLRRAFAAMAAVGRTPGGGVTRLALTPPHLDARRLLRSWAEELGLEVLTDDAGNLSVVRPAAAVGDPAALPLVIGSHLDSVVEGGRFDGALGVVAGMEVLRALEEVRWPTRRPIRVVDFTNEEGARFRPAMLGSAVAAGVLRPEEAYAIPDAAGVRFGDALRSAGQLGPADHRPVPFAGYLELHVEQGPILEAEGFPLGVVDGVQGLVWLEAEFTGRADHAGPTPMARRADALVAAARLVETVRRLPAELSPDAVATVGTLDVHPNLPNVVPGRVRLTVDVRHPRRAVLERGAARVEAEARAIAAREGCRLRVRRRWTMEPTPFDPEIRTLLHTIAAERGVRARTITAGAGHDAKHMATVGPAGMLFVPSTGGVSHNEAEDSPWEACVTGAQVLLEAVLRLAG